MIVDETEIPAMVRALVAEIAAKVETLANHGQSDTLDLRGLPLLPRDYALLKTLLGTGEVTATITALGPTRIHETRYPGVWWVTYCNESEEVVGEIIEITACPGLLISDNAEIRAGVARLRDAFSSLSSTSRPAISIPSTISNGIRKPGRQRLKVRISLKRRVGRWRTGSRSGMA